MTTTSQAPTPPSEAAVAPSRPAEQQSPKAKPVKYWAVVGGFFLALQAYIYFRWLTSGELSATAHGPDTPPDWMLVVIRTQEVLAPLGLIVFSYFFLYRPWKRNGRIGLDGLLIFVALAVWWQDPLVNYTQTFATYNTFFLNFGSWSEFVPGWMAPNGSNFAEPVLWTGPAYVWGMIGGIIVANKFMAKVKERRPQTGTLGIILTGYLFFIFFDILFELFFVRLGVFVYPGAHDQLSFFSGRYYQFPVYEALIWGAAWTGFACIRYFRNDRGETVAERGIEEIRATPKQKTFIRFLALLGMFSMVFMAYNVAWAWISLNQSEWPADITDRSYFTSEICDTGTDRACPGPEIPIPRPDSDYVDRNGGLAPKG